MAGVGPQRLRKELTELTKKPVENIQAVPKESNIFEWHYVLQGAKGSDYEGGHYHGVLQFPKEYPLKPPSIQMYTPNGRFKVGL
jgi:ubiquitin-conjugating enzyme E2 J2